MSKNLKPTKRKAFNFLRSYFDVLNELEKDDDKLNFLLSIINKQFLDEDPKDLNFIVNLCYESQRHAIESSVKGWKRVNKEVPPSNPTTHPTTNPTTNPTTHPKEEEEQVEVKEKGEGKEFTPDQFLKWFNETRTKYLEIPSNCNMLTSIDKINLNQLKEHFNGKQFGIALLNLCNDQWANDNNMVIPIHFLNPDNFNKYVNIATREPLTREQKKRQNWGIS